MDKIHGVFAQFCKFHVERLVRQGYKSRLRARFGEKRECQTHVCDKTQQDAMQSDIGKNSLLSVTLRAFRCIQLPYEG